MKRKKNFSFDFRLAIPIYKYFLLFFQKCMAKFSKYLLAGYFVKYQMFEIYS